MTNPTTITTAPEQRQIARTLHFDAATAPYIDWNAIGRVARELGAHFEARYDAGACTVTVFWTEAPLNDKRRPISESAEVPQVWAHDLPNSVGLYESEVPQERAEAKKDEMSRPARRP